MRKLCVSVLAGIWGFIILFEIVIAGMMFFAELLPDARIEGDAPGLMIGLLLIGLLLSMPWADHLIFEKECDD